MKSRNVLHIMNFVRAEDFRFLDFLFDTYVKHVEVCDKYQLPYAEMLQYDAYIKEEYVQVLKDRPNPLREVGIWMELCRQLIEKVGLEWQGNPDTNWDWHVNPDMLMAYTPEQRELLIDEMMAKFREVFGYYPKTVGSWLIDSHSIRYMKEKYDIRAVLMCRDEWGTDGYTIWGGYWNQAYYASSDNMASPAQTMERQITVPIFRLLGSDPIYQYECGLDELNNPAERQTVITLEPACANAKDPKWLNWFFHCICEEENLGFGYTQNGQENSFGWTWEPYNVKDGVAIQMELVSKLVKEGKLIVEKPCDTGDWFMQTYPMTPATAVTALSDWKEEDNQTVWYNCKNYRINFFRKDGLLTIRDIFYFNENYAERYLNDIERSHCAYYDNLPIVDSYRWGGNGVRSSLFFVRPGGNEKLPGKILASTRDEHDASVLVLELLVDGERVVCRCSERGVQFLYSETPFELHYQYRTLEDTEITGFEPNGINFLHNNFGYALEVVGTVTPEDSGYRIAPAGKVLALRPCHNVGD